MRIKRRMSAAEFNAVRPFLKISEDRIEAARRALVDGETLQAVGKHYGWSRQAVGDAVGVVWRAFADYRESQQATAAAVGHLPPGWDSVTLIAPHELIRKFREEISKATKKLSKQPKSPDSRKRKGVSGSGCS